MKNTTVIIPIHELHEEYLANAINSLEKQKNLDAKIKTLLVIPTELELGVNLFLKKNKYKNLVIDKIINTGKTDFQSQINFAVDNIDTEYFTLLEFDDEFSEIYFKTLNKYIQHYPEIDSFLPILVEVNKEGEVVKLTNEFVWSKSFINDEEFGYLTNDLLKDFSYFFISGATIKKQKFIESGKLKINFDVSAVYEFLLRFTYQNNTVFVIPKIGYSHLNDREGSATKYFVAKYKEKDSKEEFERARKEHIFIS
jgi:hypothetical protein